MVDTLLLLCQIKIYQLIRRADPDMVYNSGKLLEDLFALCVDPRLASVSGPNFERVYLYAWRQPGFSFSKDRKKGYVNFELQIGYDGQFREYDARSPPFPYACHVYGGLTSMGSVGEEWEVSVWWRYYKRELKFMIVDDEMTPNWHTLMMQGWNRLRLDQDDFKDLSKHVIISHEMSRPRALVEQDREEQRTKRRRPPAPEDIVIHIDD
jgi:hypothetical protein